jgi:hypothetical protein
VDLDPAGPQALDLAQVVGVQLDRRHAERVQHRRRRRVVAQVVVVAEVQVGLDRVEPVLLQLVGADLLGDADAPALLPQVQDDAALGSPAMRA